MTQAGWYPDPSTPNQQRWWDGTAWSSNTAPLQVAAPASPLRYDGDSVMVESRAVAGGLAPQACVPHGRTGSTAKVTFQSRTPWWVWLTVLVGLLVALILALVLRKTVIAPAWPVCDECRRERRQRLLIAWLALGLWIPALWLAGSIFGSMGDGAAIAAFSVAFFVPILASIYYGSQASYAARLKGVVSQDGLTVAFPRDTFGRTTSEPPASVAAVAKAAGLPSGFDGTILPGR